MGCKYQKSHINTQDAIYFKNGKVITADLSGKITEDINHLVIQGDSILYFGKNAPQLLGSYKTIDISNKYIIPGLIDSHVHLGHTGIFKDEHYETYPNLIKDYYKQLPRNYLYFGFTTLIDLDLKERTKKQFYQANVRPNLFSSGRGVRYFDGYGHSLFPKPLRYKIFPKWIYDYSQLKTLPKDIDLNRYSIETVIEESIDEGAIAIKTYYEKGFGGAFNWPVPSDSLLSRLVSKSHRYNLPVLLHATSYEAYEAGLRNNIDVFAHGLWHWNANKLDSKPPKTLSSLYKRIANANKYIQSTSRVILGEYDTYKWSLANNTNIVHVYNKEILKFLKDSEGRWSQLELESLYESKKPDDTVPNEVYFEAMNSRVANSIKLAHQLGVKLILGSDTPASDGIGNPPGLNGLLEMKSLYDFGIPLEDIFLAATIRNAEAFHLDEKIGSIKEGKQADILILDKNPLKDINAYNSIETVIIKGKLIDRILLSAQNLE
ncbi:amidohydrolase family protein [uncultured Psychroserpens sp.]|uniref:amidohydrolase family protein n=1 Tax=uncultured Psychroserpens sp. TaxID=255436 RepID=UPI0026202790|nr:amidohydrolase family protein [uncultured Psychroserpens sp.]